MTTINLFVSTSLPLIKFFVDSKLPLKRRNYLNDVYIHDTTKNQQWNFEPQIKLLGQLVGLYSDLVSDHCLCFT